MLGALFGPFAFSEALTFYGYDLWFQYMKNETFKKLPLVPLRDVVVFPHITLPLYVGREKSLNAIEESQKYSGEILLVTQKNGQSSDPTADDFFSVGTRAVIKQYAKLSDGNVKILIEGKERVRLTSVSATSTYFEAAFEPLPEIRGADAEEHKWMTTVLKHLEAHFKATSRSFEEIEEILGSITDTHEFVDLVTFQVSLKLKDRQDILEILDPITRLEKLSTLILSEIELIKLDRKIKDQVREKIEKSQKEFFLNEQMSAIQKELGGEGADFKEEMQALEKRLAEKDMPPAAKERATKELKRLKLSNGHAAEASVIRSYLDLILELPWNEVSKDQNDLSRAETILNEDHFGLKDIKERILEFLAVRAKTDTHKSPIICFAGPPGVGKTSLAKSIARTLDRKFERISLGGIRDESELRGHRRTYVAAMSGKIINAIRKAGTSNPVILLDEIDKIGTDYRGDPGSALLEILDPEQNKFFTDHYLDLEYDLSKVMFIATANILDTISAPLKDRMEIIPLSGYSETEKVEIAKQYLIPRENKDHGLSESYVKLTDKVLISIIQNYTRESGVRNLEREIAKICRKLVKQIAKTGHEDENLNLDEKAIESLLGVPRFKTSSFGKIPEVGVVTGLAWTPYGGDLLTVEANILAGKGKVQITGQLGDVMQESAKAALSYIRSRAYRYGLDEDYFSTKDVHIHVPEGAIPKDGPSAGVTMATAILSAILKIPVSKELGMTGEITLRGRVLPIGGLKEKLLAARRGQLKTIFYPFENEKDKADLEAPITEGLELIPVYQVDEIIERVLAGVDLKKSTSGFYVDQKSKGSTLGPSGPLL
ncbi:MAG: ATP-dependent Lon protease [Bacteriovoracaceae bacterium]|nr:ATP-dependent Lon protease [Bacteriovoracaceae bacterium]